MYKYNITQIKYDSIYYAGCFLLTLVIYTHISACKNENILNYIRNESVLNGIKNEVVSWLYQLRLVL